jgi:hypothetical protein
VQAADELAPTVVEKEPATQSLQAELLCAPVSGEYCPGGHLTQNGKLGTLNVPCSQTVHADDPTVEKYPLWQSIQSAPESAPDAVEYFPEGQRAHALLAESEKAPAPHTRQTDDPLGEYDPGRHPTHTSELIAPGIVECFPAIHNRHFEALPFPKLPASHKWQALDPTVSE